MERLVRFKGALGLSDEEAAPVHITVGQRMMRGRIEAPDRYSEAQERRVCTRPPPALLKYLCRLASRTLPKPSRNPVCVLRGVCVLQAYVCDLLRNRGNVANCYQEM